MGNIESVSHFRRGPFEGQVRNVYEGPEGRNEGKEGKEGKEKGNDTDREREREATQEESERRRDPQLRLTKDVVVRGWARVGPMFNRPSTTTKSPDVPKAVDTLDILEALRTSRPAATRHVGSISSPIVIDTKPPF